MQPRAISELPFGRRPCAARELVHRVNAARVLAAADGTGTLLAHEPPIRIDGSGQYGAGHVATGCTPRAIERDGQNPHRICAWAQALGAFCHGGAFWRRTGRPSRSASGRYGACCRPPWSSTTSNCHEPAWRAHDSECLTAFTVSWVRRCSGKMANSTSWRALGSRDASSRS